MTTLEFNRGLAERGDARPLNASSLAAATLKADTEVTVWSKQCANDELIFHGHGGKNRQAADTKYMKALIKASGAGTGTAGDEVNGELVAAITDSDQRRVLASVTLGDLDQLGEMASVDPTERPVMYALAPYAKPGRHLEFRVVADSSSDGVEIDNDQSVSDVKLWYSVIN